MAYLAPIHRPSSIRHAIKLNLISADEEVLVLAKANRIEIWQQSAETGLLIMLQSKAIHGRVTMLQSIRPYWSRTDHLFVGTQRFQYFTLDWDPEYNSLRTVKTFVDVSEKHMRDSQSRDRCLVEPQGKHLMLELFEGVLSFVRLNRPRRGQGQNPTEYMDPPEQIRISELRVRSTCFLHTETNRPKLAVLYDSGYTGDVRLATYRIVDEKGQYSNFDHTKDRENEVDVLDIGASHLIPVPKGENVEKRYIVRNATDAKAQVGGVIVVGETKMTYFDDESKALVEYALNEALIWVAWERYNDLEYFLADDYGGLHVLSLLTDESGFVTGMQVKRLGTTTKATSLVYLENGVLFIASHEGDTELVKVSDTGVQILQTMPNIAPILDFAVMDLGGREGESQSNEYASGQARLVTGSGAYETGSLRSVRSGVGLEDVGILLDLQDIQNIFSLKSEGLEDDVLVVSLPNETRIFLFKEGGEIEELEDYRGLITAEQTLQVYGYSNGDLLQVTPSIVHCHLFQKAEGKRWQPPEGHNVTAASANESHVLLAINGTKLVSLSAHSLAEAAFNDLGEGDEVACVHLPRLASETAPLLKCIGVVGFWKSGSISVLDMSDLSIIQSESLRRQNNASIPRDIALTRVLTEKGDLNLFIAMEDGVVLSFQMDQTSFTLYGRKSVVLGTQQARLTVLPRSEEKIFNVFATCEHPSLIYGSEGRIVYSAVTADDANFVAPFDNETFHNCIILASSTELKISSIDNERRTHVRTLAMGKTIRRIAYSPKERAFGIGAIRRELIDGEEIIESSFELVEDVLFNQIGKPFLLQDSNGQELVECVTRAALPISHSGIMEEEERFLVGTSYLSETATAQNAGGRLLVFGIDSVTRTPFLVCSHVIRGACRQIAILDGKIVASLVKTVVMYKYEETSTSSATLTKLAAYRTSTCPIDLSITDDNIIAVADLMKSVSLVQYEAGVNGEPDKLTEVARHHQACWATAVASLGNDEWLEADQDGNLIVLKRNVDGLMETDRKKLDVIAEGNLGEMVNCIRRIDVEPAANALIVPKAFLATTEGSIYLLSSIPPSSFSFLSTLQSLLANFFSPEVPTKIHEEPKPAFTTLGNLDFNTYRAFKNQERETAEPYRFIDGELIERFLDLTETMQLDLLKGTGLNVEDVRGRVEELRRGH